MRPLPPPDDEEKPFIVRWNVLTRILLVESSVKLVARSAMDFAGFEDGSSCYPSNERICRETGYSDKTVRTAWAVLRGLGMAVRVAHGVAHRRLADEYQLTIPDGWRDLPVLGPHCGKFRCFYCGKPFNPQGNSHVNARPEDKPGDDSVSFDLRPMCFCPAPRKAGRSLPLSCPDLWDEDRREAGLPPFARLGRDQWEVFQQARGDDW